MTTVTDEISKLIKEKGINLANLARKTNISYYALYSSVGDGKSSHARPLRDSELLSICHFLEIDPMRFYKKEVQ